MKRIQAVEGFTPCWVWQLKPDKHGYGYGTDTKATGGSARAAYRISYQAFVGPIPDGLHVDHLCNNRICVNPSHLEPVAQRENCLRAVERDYVNGTGHWDQLEVCRRGLHPMSGTNLLTDFHGGRWHRGCRACQSAQAAIYRAEHPEAELRGRRARQARDRAKTAERKAARKLAKLNAA
ncbi:HNH endonuclease [Cryobacterium melibiosiphilum]|uniref:HNH endonuclease n=1 Tax=Cryobacterium melibiosiphilum TaxID=995039 RepID=A0A3A5MDF7_9MICO|nr:HNH endonuclease [Cryobacterium melibiosiphilum]